MPLKTTILAVHKTGGDIDANTEYVTEAMLRGNGDVGATVDRELVVTTYYAKTSFTGATAGDTITLTQVIDVSGTPSTVSSIWRNQSTGLDLSGAPAIGTQIELVGQSALTNGQLRASPVDVATGLDTDIAAIRTGLKDDGLVLQFNNIANAPVTASSVSAWNGYFGTDVFTEAVVASNSVTLRGIGQFTLPVSTFQNSTSLTAFYDYSGYAVGARNNCFKNATTLTKLILQKGFESAGYSFCQGCTALTDATTFLKFCGSSSFNGCTSLVNFSHDLEHAEYSFLNNSSSLEEVSYDSLITSSSYLLAGTSAYVISLPNLQTTQDGFVSNHTALEMLIASSLVNAGTLFLANSTANFQTWHLESLKAVGTGSFTGISGKNITVYVNPFFAANNAQYLAFKALNTVTEIIVTDWELGQKTSAASRPVVIASDQSAIAVSNPSLGETNASAATDTTGSWSLNSLLRLVINRLRAVQYNAGISGTDYALATNAVVHGESTAGGGTYVGLKVSPSGAAQVDATIADSVLTEFHNHHLSAFGDLTTVPLTQIVDMDFVNGLDDSCLVATSGTGASVTVTNNQAVITSGTSSNGYAILYAAYPTRYRARLGIRAAFTPVFDTPIANCMQLKGMANFAAATPQTLLDGYFFGYYVGTDSTSTAYTGTTFGILHRNNASGSIVDRFYPTTQWIDPMNGSGASGVNWDKTKGMTVEIDYPYQGYGCIFFKATVPSTGEYTDILIIPYPNTADIPQLSNPNLRYWDGVINSGNTTSKSTKVGSVGTFICGQKRYTSRLFPMKNSKSVSNGTALCLLAIQIPATFNASAVRGLARLAILTAFSGGNSFGFIDIVLNPTITGASWALNDTALTVPTGGTVSLTGSTGAYTVNSSAGTFAINPFIVDTTGTTISGGRLIDSVALGTNTNIEVDYISASDTEMPTIQAGDTIAFVAQPQANGTMGVTVKMINEL